MLQIPNSRPVWVVSVQAAYRAGQTSGRTELAQGLALVRSPVQGGAAKLVGFTQPGGNPAWISRGGESIVGIGQYADESGLFAATAHIEGVSLTLFSRKEVPPYAVPDSRIWKMPFNDTPGSGWRLIRDTLESRARVHSIPGR